MATMSVFSSPFTSAKATAYPMPRFASTVCSTNFGNGSSAGRRLPDEAITPYTDPIRKTAPQTDGRIRVFTSQFQPHRNQDLLPEVTATAGYPSQMLGPQQNRMAIV